MMREKYRAVTLLNKSYIILASIICVKLVPCVEELIREYQGGFWSGRSTVHKIFTMREILEKCREQNIDVCQLFTDFQAPYDTIWRKEVWSECIN
jgi:hypothetical protein